MNRVWYNTFRTGNIYDGLGKSGPTPEGLRKDMEGTWDFVWEWGVNDDLEEAQLRLGDLGVFEVY